VASEIRLDVPDQDTLARLSGMALPLGLREGAARRDAFRDVFYDTSDAELRERGITVVVRHRSDDTRELKLALSGIGTARVEYAAETPEADAAAIFSGDSDPARRLRALVDPSRLVPCLEMSIDRQVRTGRKSILPLQQFELACESLTARGEEAKSEFRQLVIRRLRNGGPSLEALAAAFAEPLGLRVTLDDPLTRGLQSLESIESQALAKAVQEHHEVTVLAVESGRIALQRARDDLRLPFRAGVGEDACRELMREAFGSGEGQIVKLGVVPATPTRPALEVWLARRLSRSVAASSSAYQWFLPAEILERIGSPVLRDPRTLGALTIASRSEALPEWSAGARDGWRVETSLPTDEYAVSSRQTLTALQVPILREEALDVKTRAPEQYLNAELSWLEFNLRVLALAEDPSVPLLARVRFLAISNMNLDEFFQVKVAGFKQAAAMGITDLSADGLTPAEALDALLIRLRAFIERQYRCLEVLLHRDLVAEGIEIRPWAELAEDQRAYLRTYFETQAFPLLTPRAITRAPGHPFPMIDELHMTLALLVMDPATKRTQLAHLKVPDSLPRFVRLPNTDHFVAFEGIVQACAGSLYPGRAVEGAYPFRIVRAGDIDLDERSAASFSQAIEEQLRRRSVAPVVRFDAVKSIPKTIRDTLLREMRFEDTGQAGGLTEGDVYDVPSIVDLSGLIDLTKIDRPELDYPPFTPARPFPTKRSVFDWIDEGDRLVHYPYDEFGSTFERFIVEAADDPDVVAIKLTLYRPGGPSQMGDAIRRAAESGKDMSVFVELKARFDEQRNIAWAKQLERAGIHVVTGLVKYKTHAKIALVVRRTNGELRRYAQISTGNYNPGSAKLYTDIGLFTTDEGITSDISTLFNELTGSTLAPQATYEHLLVAPTNMRTRLLELIEREIEHARNGHRAHIRAKMNALADPTIIEALYRASQGGVDIDLVIRGFCVLRPGVPMLSERVRVVSLLGRFLEHGRIFSFHNADEPEYYIGSADWRPRNLKRRVEVITPVRAPDLKARLDRILQAEIDDALAWELGSDGTYTQVTAPTGMELVSAQELFLREAAERTASVVG
jgi:polyphosphate kinase